ncbi:MULTISPECIES: hypothetical protein [Serratia]|uniref:hypothetical protein n=1 Tax=Serratia TaxID=613 RepID=UPI003FA68A8C
MNDLEIDRSVTGVLVTELKKYGCKTVTVMQSYDELADRHYKPRPAFRDWVRRLKEGERLPRAGILTGQKRKHSNNKAPGGAFFCSAYWTGPFTLVRKLINSVLCTFISVGNSLRV